MTDEEERAISQIAESLESGNFNSADGAVALKRLLEQVEIKRGIGRRHRFATAAIALLNHGDTPDGLRGMIKEILQTKSITAWAGQPFMNRRGTARKPEPCDYPRNGEPLDGEGWKRTNSQKG